MDNNISFIDYNIKDVNELLKETHNYIKWQAPLDIAYMSRDDIFKVSCEAMRITVRLTQIIGWLMLQKAILEGEFSQETVLSDQCLILQGKTCLDSSSETDLHLPPRLRELLKESRELYVRTMRLEALSLKHLPPPEEIRRKRTKGYPFVPHLCSKKNTKDSR